MPASFVQTSFLGGEWSERAQGRLEDPRYSTALNKFLNHLPAEEGAAVRRPGMRFDATTRNGAAGRVVDFTYQTDTPTTMEFTDGHLRFFREHDLVLDAGAPSVTNITTATPAVVTVDAAQTWVAGDQAEFEPTDAVTIATVPLLLNRLFSLTPVSTTQFSIFDAITGDPIDGSTLGWTGALSLALGRVTDLVTPYLAGQWATARTVQDETDVTVLQSNNAPQVVSASGTGGFSIAAAQFMDGPYLDPFKNSTITPDALTGLVNLSLGFAAYDATKAYAIGDYVTSVSVAYVSIANANLGHTPASSPTYWTPSSFGAAVGTNGFTASDVGRHVRILSEPPDWVTGTTYTTGNVVKFNGVYWTALAGMAGASPAAGDINPNQPGNLTTTWALNSTGARWTWGVVTALSTSGQVVSSNGTIIGDLNNLAYAFDDVTIGSYTGAGGVSNAGGYVGKHFATPQTITSCRVYGVYDTIDSATIALRLYGKHTAPSGSADGTLLCPQQVVSGNNSSVITFIPTDPTIAWEYCWVYQLSQKASANLVTHLAEVQFFTGNNPVGSGVQLQLRGDPLLYTTASRTWRLGLFNATGPVWPTCGCYHEGRLWLGGAVKNRFDASASNDLFNFAPTAPTGAVGDANAISETMNSSELNQLLWMNPGEKGITGGTAGGEWLISAPTQGGLSPTNIKAVRVTDYGCANIEPRKTGLTTVFVQGYRQRLIEYLADAFSGKFQGPNLSEKAGHLAENNISEIAYQEGASPTIWVRMDDGSLAGLTYRRTSSLASQPPEFAAWHPHVLGSGRHVESICVSPSEAGALKTLRMVTNDPATGIRHVETMTTPMKQRADITSAFFLDDAVVPTSGTTVGAAIRFDGLWHLNGKTVSVWAAGVDCGDFAVANGFVTVPFAGLFTKRWLVQLAALAQTTPYDVLVDQGEVTIPVVIGFTYASRGQTLRPVSQAATGAQTGPGFAKTKRTHQFAAQLLKTQGIKFGPDFDNLRPARLRSNGNRVLENTALFSGILWDTLDDTSSTEGWVAWEISRPYPATVVALGGFLHTEG